MIPAHKPGQARSSNRAPQVSAANQKAIEAAGLSFILGARVSEVPYVVSKWRAEYPDEQIPDGHVFTQPWPAAASDNRRDQVIYYQYKADRAGGRYAASTSRSPRPRRPWPAKRRSSGTGSSSSPVAPRA
jgi:hypothetical protein